VSNQDQDQTKTQEVDILYRSNELSEDIEIFLENENSIEDQGLPEPTNSKYIPEVGMQFKMRQNISAMSMLIWQDSLWLLLALIGQ